MRRKRRRFGVSRWLSETSKWGAGMISVPGFGKSCRKRVQAKQVERGTILFGSFFLFRFCHRNAMEAGAKRTEREARSGESVVVS